MSKSVCSMCIVAMSLVCTQASAESVRVQLYSGGHAVANYDAEAALSRRFIYNGGQRIAEESVGPESAFTQFLVTDHIGSASVTVGLSGDVVTAETNWLFGQTMLVEEQFPDALSETRHAGKEVDEESGWQHFGARQYDPIIGRFASVDVAANKFPNITPYNYVANNPMVLTDPDGREVIWNHGLENFAAHTTQVVSNMRSKSRLFDLALQDLENSDNVYEIHIDTTEGADFFLASMMSASLRDVLQNSQIHSNDEVLSEFMADLAKEVFHLYQTEQGVAGCASCTEYELDAMVFALWVLDDLGRTIELTRIEEEGTAESTHKYLGEDWIVYDQAMARLQKRKFSERDFALASATVQSSRANLYGQFNMKRHCGYYCALVENIHDRALAVQERESREKEDRGRGGGRRR